MAAIPRALPLLCLSLLLREAPGAPPAEGKDRCESKRVPQHSRCTGCPPMHEGKLCASTTRYNDQTKAACGCGNSDPIPEDWWTLTKLTAALNCVNLDPQHPSLAWCPEGCGGCYRLCSTGGTTQGKPTKAGVCRVFKITNRCGDGYDLVNGRDWCSQHMTWQGCQADPAECRREGATNWFGYPAHFDLQDFHLQASDGPGGLGWDNVEVTFEPVPCHEGNWTGPKWDCQCPARESRGSGSSGALPHGPKPERPKTCAAAGEQCGGKHWWGSDCCEGGCECREGFSLFTKYCHPRHPFANSCKDADIAV